MSETKARLKIEFQWAREKYISSENLEDSNYFRGYLAGVLSASYLAEQISNEELKTITEKLAKEDADFIKLCSE